MGRWGCWEGTGLEVKGDSSLSFPQDSLFQRKFSIRRLQGNRKCKDPSLLPPPPTLSDDSYLLSLTGLSWGKITLAVCFKHWESLFHSQGMEEDASLGSV